MSEDPPPDPGHFSLSWSISDGSGGEVSCGDAGATGVHVGMVAGGAEFAQTFACDLASGVSGALPPGSYDLTLALVDAGGATLATSPELPDLELRAGATTTVPEVELTVGSARAARRSAR